MKGTSMRQSRWNYTAFIFLFLGLVLSFAIGMECGQNDPAEKLLGEWVVADKYGKGEGEAEFRADMTYTLKETHSDGLTVIHDGEYRLDPSKEPCSVDLCVGKFNNAGSEWVTTFGILRFISDDEAEIHFDPSGKRPDSFENSPPDYIHKLMRKK